jgi:hypothetical protein
MFDLDRGFKMLTHESGRQLAEMAGVSCQQWEAIPGDVQTTERLADRVFRARQRGERFVVYMEAYTYWDKAAPWNILAKSALLSERERLPTRTLVYIFRPRGYRSQGGRFRLTVGKETTQQVCFREICLWKKAPQRWWEKVPGLMALYPLYRHQHPLPVAVAYAAGVIEQIVPDGILRADLLNVLGFFGNLVNPQLDVRQIIGEGRMKESRLYRDILKDGSLLARREDILRSLQRRFGPQVPTEFEAPLGVINDLERLARLLDLANECQQPDEFRRALVVRRRAKR